MRRMSRRVGIGSIVLALTTVALGSAHAAQDVLSLVTNQDCFARQYDADHLSAHPRQRVEAVWLSHEGTRNASGRTELILAFRIGGATFGSTATCRSDRCALEGDGGTFTLRRAGRDLQLTVGDRLSIEGAQGFSPDLARSTDDRVFRLRPSSRSVCRAVSF